MKRFYYPLAIGALMAATSLQAAAQYSCDPTTEALLEKTTPSKLWYVTLSETSVETFTKKGTDVVYAGPDADAGRNFWYWAGWVAGPETNPRVGMEDGGYMSLTVTGEAGWSGGGVAINGPKSDTPGAGIDLSGMTDDTHFHFAYCTNGTAPTSVAIIILDDNANGSAPAKMSIGAQAFDDNGTIFPLVGGKITDEWQGIDIKFSDLKKLWPAFKPANMQTWGGNIISMLSGNVAQTNFCLDAIYFYNEGQQGGINGVEADAAEFVITANTVNSTVAGIEIYNVAGQKVKATAATTLGISDLAKGMYIAKSGSKTQKFVK